MIFLWTFFEIAGTIAFAISGALVGISRRMDIFGILVLALSTAIGGGIIRDVLVGNIPPNSFKTSLYIVLTTVITFIIFFIYIMERCIARRQCRFLCRHKSVLGSLFTQKNPPTASACGRDLFLNSEVMVRLI